MRRRNVLPLSMLFCGLLGMSLITGLDMYPKLNRAMTYKAPTQQLCTVKDRDPARGCVVVDLMYDPYGETCVYRNGDSSLVGAMQGTSLAQYLNSYDVGSQHTCYYPKAEGVAKMTFNSPARSEGLIFSFTILLPFVFVTLTSCFLLLNKPKPHLTTMVQRTEKLIEKHDRKVKKLNEDKLKEIATLKGKIEREQEKRLQFVTELTQERAERLRQYDDLKDDLIKDFSRVEEKLNLKKGDISGSGILPHTPTRPGAGLLDVAKKTKRRQSTAIDAERQRQDEIFKKKLAERRRNRV